MNVDMIRQDGMQGWKRLCLLLLSAFLCACQNSEETSGGAAENRPDGGAPTMTVTAATTIVTTAIPMPTATATATATPVPSPTPMVASPPPLASERYYEPEALRLYAQYIRDHYVQPAIDVPVREAIMAAEELNFILIPIPNEFQQRVSFVPHPAGEMKVVFVPDSSESLLALIEDPTWFAALTSGYAGSSGKTLGWFEFKELAVGEIVVTYVVYQAQPEPDRLAFSPTDILYASRGYRGLYFVGPIE